MSFELLLSIAVAGEIPRIEYVREGALHTLNKPPAILLVFAARCCSIQGGASGVFWFHLVLGRASAVEAAVPSSQDGEETFSAQFGAVSAVSAATRLCASRLMNYGSFGCTYDLLRGGRARVPDLHYSVSH